MKNNFQEKGVVELAPNELDEIHGGLLELFLPILISYVIIDIALNPQASWDAFKRGFNS